MNRLFQRWLVLFVLLTIGLYVFLYNKDLPSLLRPSEPHHVDWSKIPQKHPLASYVSLPTGAPDQLPDVQAKSFLETDEQKAERLRRRDAVRDVFLRSWKAYKGAAWGHDELSPLSGSWKDHFGGWGATLVDSLDLLLLMELEEEFKDAVAACKNVDFSVTHVEVINVFETTIRFLGGLLSAHELANGKDGGVLLQKATELSEMLYHSFDTVNRMPIARWAWERSYHGDPEEAHSYTLAAELGSTSLEFTKMTQITGDDRFYDAVNRISGVLEREQDRTKIPGLWPIAFDAQNMTFKDETGFTMGGREDSMYEYVLKEYILLGGRSDQHRTMYDKYLAKAKDELFFKPMNPDNLDILLVGSAEIDANQNIKLIPEGQHLSCFVGGLVALGAKVFQRPDDLGVARKLVDGCVWAYSMTPTGIMPEVFSTIPPPAKGQKNKWDRARWIDGVKEKYPVGSKDEAKDENARAEQVVKSMKLPEGVTKIGDSRYILRPEAIESVFVLYRITGEHKYQDIAWKMFQSIEAATRTSLSYASIQDVTNLGSEKTDASESFWMGETLKYFFLIFSEPNVLSLDDWVLSTEAHPFWIPKPE